MNRRVQDLVLGGIRRVEFRDGAPGAGDQDAIGGLDVAAKKLASMASLYFVENDGRRAYG